MTPAKWLILLGLALVLVGLYLHLGGKLPPLGRLPGDIRIERDNYSFYFPVTSCILVSLLVSLLFWLFRR